MQGAPISGGEADRPADAARVGAGAGTDERHRPRAMWCALARALPDLPASPAAGNPGAGPVRLRRRARHSRPVIELTADEARTAYLACRDAEACRRWHTRTPCAQCRSAGTGACARHARDLNLADGYARRRAQLGGHFPYPENGGRPG